MANELKPCPFCGGKARYTKEILSAGLAAVVMCSDNDCCTNHAETLQKAIDLWNTRPAAPVEGLETTEEVIGVGATVWVRVDENRDGSQELSVTEAFGLSEVPDGEYLFVREGTRSQAEAIIAAKVEQERLRFEGELDKWMKTIGAGITGYQPEAYALMDLACQELVKLRADNAALTARIKEETARGDKVQARLTAMSNTIVRLRDVLVLVTDNIEDDGDRSYFGSSNDADTLKDVVEELGGWAWDDIISDGELPDVYETSRNAINRAEALETQLAAARKALEYISGIGFVAAKDAPAHHDEAVKVARAALEDRP